MKWLLAATAFSIQPLVSGDVLEPSVANEVEHALSVAPPEAFAPAPTNSCLAATADVFGTNGLNATEIAIRLVSAQKADGRWFAGTNDVTRAAVALLQSLLGG
jgi:hypothetical protein